MNIEPRPAEFDAWNPGLQSELPREYLPLSTIFRGENVSTSAPKAHERVAFRPDRLIAHEVLIHVTAGISVPDGRDYEDLGKNFREIAAIILNRYVAPHRDELVRIFERVKNDASRIIEGELTKAFVEHKPGVEGPGEGRRLFSFARPKKPSTSVESIAERDQRIVADWQRKSEAAVERLDEACFPAFHQVPPGVPKGAR